MKDTIYRQDAIDALWKALYEYEDETEKQFQESEDLDLKDWILHRDFVQNMSDIDRQTILELPSAQSEQSVAQERYEDLCEYFGNDHDDIKTVLGDRKEFKAWLERLKWHVKECNKLSRQLEAQPEIIRCKDCKHWDGFRKGRFWYAEYCSLHQCAEQSDDFCSQAERR